MRDQQNVLIQWRMRKVHFRYTQYLNNERVDNPTLSNVQVCYFKYTENTQPLRNTDMIKFSKGVIV